MLRYCRPSMLEPISGEVLPLWAKFPYNRAKALNVRLTNEKQEKLDYICILIWHGRARLGSARLGGVRSGMVWQGIKIGAS